MTNVVVITGRLCADPESRQTQSGTAVCHFRLAVGRNRKVEGKPEADFISCVCWGKDIDNGKKQCDECYRNSVHAMEIAREKVKDGFRSHKLVLGKTGRKT